MLNYNDDHHELSNYMHYLPDQVQLAHDERILANGVNGVVFNLVVYFPEGNYLL